MKQDDFDIPEVFRRAMEEAGWRADRDDDGGRPPRRTVTPSSRPRGVNRMMLLVFLVLLLFFSLGSIADFYTDYLWFGALGFRDLFLKRLGVRVAAFVAAFLVAAAFLAGNWLFARNRALRSTSGGTVAGGTVIGGTVNGANEALAHPRARTLILVAAAVMAILFALAASSQWEELLLYLNAEPFGVVDPVFGRDAAFYIFNLPVYRFLQGWLFMLLLIALVGLPMIYTTINLGELQRGRWRPLAAPLLRAHAAALGALLLFVWSVDYFFDIAGLLYSSRGVAYGASYTDMSVVIWALRLQIILAVLTGLALLYNVFRPNLRLPLIAGGLWVLVAVVGGGLLPGIIQRYVVEPNELTLETPYIENNIELTRFAYGLDRVETREFGQVEDLQPRDLLENEDVLSNIRLWDWRPLEQTYRQLQGLRPYYDFSDVDIDRYMIDGKQRQVMLGTRELDKRKLPAPSWVNRSLEFTHGFGIVMNPVNEVTRDGQPEFFIKDFPPESNTSVKVTRPEIYYGELTTDTVYVGSNRQEFDYPSGDSNIYTNYSGEGGVVLDTWLKRLAFVLREGDPNILLSNDITSTTRAQFRRQVQSRIREITPFLILDGDPYMVVDDAGRLIWMQDAYTASDAFPYATPMQITEKPGTTAAEGQFERIHAINYIRNSAKITLDAYNGTVNYYLSDPSDPIINSYARAFPGVFQPMSAMPADLQAHVRYPEDLFTIQSRQYITYHMTDVRVFYNKEDLWQIPTEISNTGETTAEPYYVILPLPGSDESEYLLILPFSPATRNNMIGWMAARNDPAHYGQLIVYELPKQELIFGPIQIEGRINQEPIISQQFSLWDQRGSNVIRGNLLVLPINRSFLYIEPVYLLSETSALPELKRIVTAGNTSIAMAETLRGSLLALAQGTTTAAPLTPDEPPGVNEPPAGGAGATPIPETLEQLVAAANAHMQAAEAAQREGDWATYGRELDALRAVLADLARLTGQDE